jgi:hypothetical protein
MKKICVLLFLGGFLASCIQNNSTNNVGIRSEERVRKEVIIFVVNYLKGKLKDPKLPVEEENMITITGEGSGYAINLPKMVIGKIDEDNYNDAIVPVYELRGQSLIGYKHLILLKPEGKYIVAETMNDVLSIIGIEDMDIIAEVSTVSPDSPGFGCDECKEVVRYQLKNGELIRLK